MEIVGASALDRLLPEEVVRHLLDGGGDARRAQHLLRVLEDEPRALYLWVGFVERDH